MLYFVSSSTLPLRYISGGQLKADNGFLHPKRILDTFVLIVGNRGVFHIEQNETIHTIGKNRYILLFPGMQHTGHFSGGEVSYYWCHFKVQHDRYQIESGQDRGQQFNLLKESAVNSTNNYIIPEVGTLFEGERSIMLFRQLLDAAKRKSHSEYLANYALSLLAMEISTDFVSGYRVGEVTAAYKNILEIMEWIRVHYASVQGINDVAETFSYNPNYLSAVFKKHAGCSLVDYIVKMKINAAKKQLLSSDDMVKVIAQRAGFEDEKYFMKIFKKQEGVTPSQYRNAFYRRHTNA